ncbi:hypothetical protein NG701_15035 [Pseudarthrobacter sp. HLT3-5]|nr:hypothetical protein [Pseudarthrobacter sp. HLT3-5]
MGTVDATLPCVRFHEGDFRVHRTAPEGLSPGSVDLRLRPGEQQMDADF